MPRYVILLMAALTIAACQTNQSYSRIDGQAATTSELRHARLICDQKAIAAGSLASDGIKKAVAEMSTMESCMAERGLVAGRR